MTATIQYNAFCNKTQAAAIMQAFRSAQVEDLHDAHRMAALRAAMTAKVTNWSRA